MIPLFLALAIAAPPTSSAVVDNYKSCTELVKTNPDQAVAQANDWLIKGGGVLARQCLGLAYTELGQWAPAATSFEAAAREAEKKQDPIRTDFLVQAGNGWLAAGEAAKARAAFDAALATTALTPQLRGEVDLDRARADVSLGDPASARRDIDQALELVPGDAMVWYLSSALALKQKDIPRAEADIVKGLKLAPNDPDLLVHAGNIAGTSGDQSGAEALYMRAIRVAPNSDAAKAAKAALAANAAAPAAPAPQQPR